MKKIFLRNLIIVLSLIGLSVPYNYCVNYYAMRISTLQYVPVIIFSLLCGASLVLMDLSNKKITAVFATFYFVFILVDLQFGVFFLYGPTVYFYVLMFGALLTSILRKNKN